MTRHQERNQATDVSLQHEAKHRHRMGKSQKYEHWMLDAANLFPFRHNNGTGFCFQSLDPAEI